MGEHSLIKQPLVNFGKFLLPPLHIKLGIVKNLIKQLVKGQEVYDCLTAIFPKLSPAKIKEGMCFVVKIV